MQKIPTLFERDWDGDRSRVVDVVHADCRWVVDGEGVATRKYDGTACAVIDGRLYKRLAVPVPADTELRPDRLVFPAGSGTVVIPPDFRIVAIETSPGRKGDVTKAFGWLPVGDGPEDEWHREAWKLITRSHSDADVDFTPPDGIYELIGPKVQGNPERAAAHQLVELDTEHDDDGVQSRGPKQFPDAPRDFDGLAAWLADKDIEGLVFHHPDGRMAKIKLRDFGLTRPTA